MNQYFAIAERMGWRKVATGTWFYNKTVPIQIAVWAEPAHLAGWWSDEDDLLIESRPIPETIDGFLYFCWPGSCGDHLTIDAAKAAADAKPWGPIKWD